MISGLLGAKYTYDNVNKFQAMSFFYFSLMQLIHYLGYKVIDQCQNKWNKALSYVNYIHICFQPFVYLLGLYGLFQRFNIITVKQLSQFSLIIKFSVLAGVLSLLRLIGNKNHPLSKNNDNCIFCGDACSFSGKKHIVFTLPLRKEPVYITPTVYNHFLFFFIPLLLFNNTTRLISLFMYITANIPLYYYGIKPSENATIWCYHSIAQLFVVLVYAMMKSK